MTFFFTIVKRKLNFHHMLIGNFSHVVDFMFPDVAHQALCIRICAKKKYKHLDQISSTERYRRMIGLIGNLPNEATIGQDAEVMLPQEVFYCLFRNGNLTCSI